jgi:hypothetical protein
MATTTVPDVVLQGIASGKVSIYTSTDATTVVDDSNYFTNGDAGGMKVGDVLLSIETDNSYDQNTHSVTAVTAGGAATVSSAT